MERITCTPIRYLTTKKQNMRPYCNHSIKKMILLIAIIQLIGNHHADAESNYQFLSEWLMVDGDHPHSIAFDRAGNACVTAHYTHCIRRFTPEGELVHSWGSRGSGNAQFWGPSGIVCHSDNVYVGDVVNHRIQKFTSTGQYLTQWGTRGSEDGEFGGDNYPSYGPYGLTVDIFGNIYAADQGNCRIQKFSSNGVFMLKWGVYGTGDGQFGTNGQGYGPLGIAVDTSGNVYVSDTGNNRIQKFTSDGRFLLKWGSFGADNGQFNGPRELAVDVRSYVYVVDTGNSRIQMFNRLGHFITQWGILGAGKGQFDCPVGVTIDKSAYVYVVDSHNERIQIFAPIFDPNDVADPNDAGINICDLDSDGDVDILDFGILSEAWRSTPQDSNSWNPACDLYNPSDYCNPFDPNDVADPNDAIIDIRDLVVFVEHWLTGIVPAGHWRLDNDYTDSTGEHDGTPIGDPVFSTEDEAKVGRGALELEGDDFIQISDYKGIPGSLARTCSAWIKTTIPSGDIFWWGDPSQPGGLWNVRLNYLGNLRFQTNGGSIYSSTVVTTGEWIHVAVVLPDGGDNTSDILLYLNGQLESSETLSITAHAINTIMGGDMRIGADNSGHYFTGLIDDVRVYDRALSAEEIAKLTKP